LGVIDKLLLLF